MALCATLAAGGCIDSTGPRPRPGGAAEPPPVTPPTLRYFELQPRVITVGQSDSVRFIVTVNGTPDGVEFESRTGFLIGFRQISAGVWSGKVATSMLLFGYHTGDLHNAAGFIQVYTGVQTTEHAVIVNVKDATVPFVDPQPVATGMQATPHIVNIRYDSIYAGEATPAAPLKQFYAQYADEYTFAAVIEQVQSERAPFFTGVRNQVRGLGLSLFDNGSRFGSGSALEGIIDYPVDANFDLAETTNIHELAHRWINYLNAVLPTSTHPHWPLSDLAYGVIGWADPQTGEPLTFPFDVVPQSNGTYLLRVTDTPRTFNDLELYLMGLLPGDSVQQHLVFRNQNQRQAVRNTGLLAGPVDTITLARITAADGARVPAANVAPRHFKLATIVLSSGRLLTRDEISFFEYMAARGEQETALPYFTGAIRGTTLPFYAATSGRGTLSTRLGLR